MEKSASDLSRQSARDEGVAKEVSGSVEEKEREKSKERSSSKHKEGSSSGSGEKKVEEKPKVIDHPKETRNVEKDKEKSSDKQQSQQVVDLKPKIKEEPNSPVKEEHSPVKENFISVVKTEIKQNPESDDLPLAQRVNQEKPEKVVKGPAKDDADDVEPLSGRWEEEKPGDDVKWTFLEHKGPVFAPLYEPLPVDIGFYYDAPAYDHYSTPSRLRSLSESYASRLVKEEKEREKSKERSSSKHKEGSSSGSGEKKEEEKPKVIDHPKETRDVEKDKEKSSDKQQSQQVVDLKPKIKEEPNSPVKEEHSPVKDNFISGVKTEIKQNPESDDLPLAQRVNQEKPEKVVKGPAKDVADDVEPLSGRWEEEKPGDDVKWTFLEHKGPVFAPLYEPLPVDIGFYYDGKKMKLSLPAEEVATFYARMLDHDYTTRDVFNSNFFKDWRKMMTPEERSTITDLKKCNFKEMYEYFKAESEERKNMSKEEKKKIKAQNEAIQNEFGICMMDGHKEKIANFRLEPPGLFRGRGDHPKQGMLKMRINPEDVIINCSRDSKIPQPPAGHRWKKVLHNNKVTWLASWNENIQGHTKYVILNATFNLKGEKGLQKYEIARRLHRTVDQIRAQYREDWKSKEMRIRQRAVALYFIDKLALRAGNEKEEGETADTVGCCSLRVEHIKLHDELDGKENVVEFDFLGEDSIRYYNTVSVDKRVYKNLKIFMDNKQPGDDLFDCLNASIMNKHLNNLMEGLTAKVFRTYNASKTLQEQLNLLTNPDDPVPAKLLSYSRANRAVAILCNHQRSVPKNFSKQMETLQSKDENKEIALYTSMLNYLDPRISVAWCKKFSVPLEKIYNETHQAKFQWAIVMAGADFEF